MDENPYEAPKATLDEATLVTPVWGQSPRGQQRLWYLCVIVSRPSRTGLFHVGPPGLRQNIFLRAIAVPGLKILG
jgi:hypothetical protein